MSRKSNLYFSLTQGWNTMNFNILANIRWFWSCPVHLSHTTINYWIDITSNMAVVNHKTLQPFFFTATEAINLVFAPLERRYSLWRIFATWIFHRKHKHLMQWNISWSISLSSPCSHASSQYILFAHLLFLCTSSCTAGFVKPFFNFQTDQWIELGQIHI